MSLGSPDSLRLVFKRVFVKYYLELHSPVIADPTEPFATCRAYLDRLHEQLGREEFMRRIDDETTHLAAQLEQDLRYRLRGSDLQLSYDDLEDRLRECFEQALGWIDSTSEQMQVE